MKLILVFLAVVLSLKAKKCDNYVVGRAWYHSQQYAADEGGSFEGCKKGCFWNETYTDDGVKKCELCSDIEDEETCLVNGATCQWKSGKCKSQTCPSLAKSGITVGGAARSSSATIINRIESYRHQVKLEDECLARTALEQKYSQTYWDDYKIRANYQYFQDNCPYRGYSTGYSERVPNPTYDVDTCTIPCSGFSSEPVSRQTRAVCEDYFGGCIYVEGATDPCMSPTQIANAYSPHTNCDIYPILDNQSLCEAYGNKSRGCRWVPAVTNPDTTITAAHCEGNLIPAPNSFPCDAFVPGESEQLNCERLGCTYTSGNASNRANLNDRCENTYTYNYGTNPDIQCLPFTPGGPTAEAACQALGCSWNPVGGGCDFKTDCPSTNNKPPSADCALNTSLNYNNLDKPCDDRLPTTPDGIPTTECRLTIDIEKQRCEFNYEFLKTEVLTIIDGDDGTGGYKPGSKHEKCLQDQVKDPHKLEPDGSNGTKRADLTTADRMKIFGFATAVEYCNNQKKLAFDECQDTYDQRVEACHGLVVSKANPTGSTHGDTKASRTACHRVYGCMYSLSNERCSVWSVWAFILTLILTILVAVGGLGVAAIFLLPILKRSSA